MALTLLACAPAADERPRVVSLLPQGTRAVVNLGLSDRLLPPQRIHDADLVLVGPGVLEPRAPRGAIVLEVAPHQLDEAFDLYREIAAALGEPERGRTTALRIGDPLGRISAAQVGKRRPLVAAVVSLDPLELAGGHSFVSNLVEVAGAETITHGSGAVRVPARVDAIRAASPELVVVALPALPDLAAQAVVRSWFAPAPVAFLAVDADALWLDGALEAATELAQHVEAVRSAPPAQ